MAVEDVNNSGTVIPPSALRCTDGCGIIGLYQCPGDREGGLLRGDVGDRTDGAHAVALTIYMVGKIISLIYRRNCIRCQNLNSTIDSKIRDFQHTFINGQRFLFISFNIQPGGQQVDLIQAIVRVQMDHIAPSGVGFPNTLRRNGVSDGSGDLRRIFEGFFCQQGDLQTAVGTHIGFDIANLRACGHGKPSITGTDHQNQAHNNQYHRCIQFL